MSEAGADFPYPVSEAHISKTVDRALDKAGAKAHYAPAGVSVRNGPILGDEMEIDQPATNGATKRKARTSTGKAVNYNVDESDDGSDDDAVPLVRRPSASNVTSHDAPLDPPSSPQPHTDRQHRPSVKGCQRRKPLIRIQMTSH